MHNIVNNSPGLYLQDHAGEQVVEDSNGVLGLVVGWDGHVHIGHAGVGVAEGDGWDVHVSGLLDGLVVCAGVSHNQQAGLLEVLLDLVGEGTCATGSLPRSSAGM